MFRLPLRSEQHVETRIGHNSGVNQRKAFSEKLLRKAVACGFRGNVADKAAVAVGPLRRVRCAPHFNGFAGESGKSGGAGDRGDPGEAHLASFGKTQCRMAVAAGDHGLADRLEAGRGERRR